MPNQTESKARQNDIPDLHWQVESKLKEIQPEVQRVICYPPENREKQRSGDSQSGQQQEHLEKDSD